jgi:hypothetical protein
VVFLSAPQKYISFTTKQVVSADSIDITENTCSPFKKNNKPLIKVLLFCYELWERYNNAMRSLKQASEIKTQQEREHDKCVVSTVK